MPAASTAVSAEQEIRDRLDHLCRTQHADMDRGNVEVGGQFLQGLGNQAGSTGSTRFTPEVDCTVMAVMQATP